MGRWGEGKVAEYLKSQGYEILAWGWSCRFGEIDLIAKRGGMLAFVEVKLRKNAAFAHAREFVDRRKQHRIITAAELYLAMNPSALQPRFDVAEVYAPDGLATCEPEIIYLEHAFFPEES